MDSNMQPSRIDEIPTLAQLRATEQIQRYGTAVWGYALALARRSRVQEPQDFASEITLDVSRKLAGGMMAKWKRDDPTTMSSTQGKEELDKRTGGNHRLGSVRVLRSRARRKFADLLREEVGKTLEKPTPDRINEELANSACSGISVRMHRNP